MPADLAVAFILSRPLRRIRLPLELAVANVLARVTPALTRIHVMQIFRSFPMYSEPDWMKDGITECAVKRFCWPPFASDQKAGGIAMVGEYEV